MTWSHIQAAGLTEKCLHLMHTGDGSFHNWKPWTSIDATSGN